MKKSIIAPGDIWRSRGIMKLLREDKTEKVDWTYVGEMYGAFERVMKRFMLGAKKYSRTNWRNCTDNQTYKESLARHLVQYLNGKTDEDHLGALIVNALILMDLEEECTGKPLMTSCTWSKTYTHNYCKYDEE